MNESIQLQITDYKKRIDWLRNNLTEAMGVYGYQRIGEEVIITMRRKESGDVLMVQFLDYEREFGLDVVEECVLESVMDDIHSLAQQSIERKRLIQKWQAVRKRLVDDHNYRTPLIAHVIDVHDLKITFIQEDHPELTIKGAAQRSVDQLVESVREYVESWLRRYCDDAPERRVFDPSKGSRIGNQPKGAWQKLKQLFT